MATTAAPSAGPPSGDSEIVLGRLKPQLTVVLDMDPELSLVRVQTRNEATAGFRETRFDAEALDFHKRVRSRFLAIAQREPQRVVVVQAHQPAERVEEAIWAKVGPLLRSFSQAQHV